MIYQHFSFFYPNKGYTKWIFIINIKEFKIQKTVLLALFFMLLLGLFAYHEQGGGTMTENRHRLILDEKTSMMLNGVSNVDSFDEDHIELSGSFGGIDIEGEGMKIASLDLEEGKITISGLIDAFAYCQSHEEKKMRHKSKKALSRLLR